MAEASYLTRVHDEERTIRLVVRRTRVTERARRALWPDYLPDRWPWVTTFTRALDQIRALPLVT